MNPYISAPKNLLYFSLLFLLDLSRNALVCKGFREFVKYMFWLASWQNWARWNKLLRAVSSKVGSRLVILTTKVFPFINIINLIYIRK